MSLQVRTASGASYPVHVARDLAPLGGLLEDLRPFSRLALVTDATVADLHLAAVLGASPEEAVVHAIAPGEASKDPDTLRDLWEFLRDAGCDRRSVVLALGGGVVGDLAGFAAATFMRGVRIVHVPTTLLAMVDSAVGGKTAIDLGAKNLVGAFHAPSGVVCHLPFLSTLPPREVRCGLGEVWKTALLSGEELLSRLEQRAEAIRALEPDALQPVVEACLSHKAGVVARDEREGGERALLNLGHTLGHALELTVDGLSHGEAVALGGAFACRLARRLGLLAEADARRFLDVARALGLPTELSDERPAVERLEALMARDKKAVGGRQRWVLPLGPGRCEVSEVDPVHVRALLEAPVR